MKATKTKSVPGGYRFYNTSEFTFAKLKNDANNIADNLTDYIKGFSDNARAILESFDIYSQIARLDRANLLYFIVTKFVGDIDLHPDRVKNNEMGYIFEELIRKFSEMSNETAGEHFTPREVIRLMVSILFTPDMGLICEPGFMAKLYDPAAGTGGMLSAGIEKAAEKTEVIVEHFRSQVQHRIGGKAKAMLVTGSRLHAVRYFFEFQKYIKKMGYTDLGILVAFSGTVKDNVTGEFKEYTEANLNKFPDTETVDKFATGEYQLLLVAEKYQTGFDQPPLLHTMYVDKRLSGVKAVQTLSRVNRTCPGKTETFILDFVNSPENIEKAIQEYYQGTGVAETTDPNTIYDIKNVLDSFMLYTDSEIDAFAKVFFKESKTQGNIDLAKLNSFIDPAVDRYEALTEEQDKMDFKGALSKFIRLYSFLTHIISLGDVNLHKFYAYAKCLIRKLPKEKGTRTPSLDNDVTLQYYRLQRAYEGTISLVKEDGVLYGKTSGTGLPLEDEQENLSVILAKLNERLGTNFTNEDKVLEQIVEDMATIDELVLRAKNPLDLFKIIYDNTIMDVVLSRMTKNQEFCEKYLEDEQFRIEIDKILLPLVHARLSKI